MKVCGGGFIRQREGAREGVGGQAGETGGRGFLS